MSARQLAAGNIRTTLFSSGITAPLTGAIQNLVQGIVGVKYVLVFAKFTYGSGGTSANAFLQTSINAGVDWFDIAALGFTTASANKMAGIVCDTGLAVSTPVSGALALNTAINGIIGDRLRVMINTTGTYASTLLTVDIVAKG